MARPLRLEYPGALYHVTSRGNGRSKIFRSSKDRTTFLTILAAVIQNYTWQLHAYCLMDNHYHLVVETPRSSHDRGYTLSAIARHLGLHYATISKIVKRVDEKK
jgi:putative transposase